MKAKYCSEYEILAFPMFRECEKCNRPRDGDNRCIYKTILGNICDKCTTELEKTDPIFALGLGGYDNRTKV